MGSSQSVEHEKAEAAKVAEAFLLAFQSHYLSAYSTINISRKYATGQLQPNHHSRNNNNNDKFRGGDNIQSTTAPGSPSSSRAADAHHQPIRPSPGINNNNSSNTPNAGSSSDSREQTVSGVSTFSVQGSEMSPTDQNASARLVGTSGQTLIMNQNITANTQRNLHQHNHQQQSHHSSSNQQSSHHQHSVTSSVVTSPNLLAGCPLDIGHHSVQLNLPFDARNWWIKKIAAADTTTNNVAISGRTKTKMRQQHHQQLLDSSITNKNNNNNDDADNNKATLTETMKARLNFGTTHSLSPLSICPEVLDLATASNISITHRHRGILLKLSDFMKQFNNRFIALQRDWRASLWEWEEHFRSGDQPRARIDLSIYADGGVKQDATDAVAEQLRALTTLMGIEWDSAPESETYPMRTVSLHEQREANNVSMMSSRGGSGGSGSVILQFGVKNEYWKQWVQWLEQGAANCSPYGILDDAVHAHAFRFAIDCAWNDVWRIYKPSSSSVNVVNIPHHHPTNNNNNSNHHQPPVGSASSSSVTPAGAGSEGHIHTHQNYNSAQQHLSPFSKSIGTVPDRESPQSSSHQQPMSRNRSSPSPATSMFEQISSSSNAMGHHHHNHNHNHHQHSSNNEFDVPPFPRHGGGETRILTTALYHLLRATVFTKFVSQKAKEVQEQNRKQKEALADREREREAQQERERKKMMLDGLMKNSKDAVFDDDNEEEVLMQLNKKNQNKNNIKNNNNYKGSSTKTTTSPTMDPTALESTQLPTALELNNKEENSNNATSTTTTGTSAVISIPTNNSHHHNKNQNNTSSAGAPPTVITHQKIKEEERVLKGKKRRKDDAQWTSLKPYCDALEKVILEESSKEISISWNTTTELVKKRNIRFDSAMSSELKQAGDCWRTAQERTMNLVGRCPHLTGVTNLIRKIATMKISSKKSNNSKNNKKRTPSQETRDNNDKHVNVIDDSDIDNDDDEEDDDDDNFVLMLVRHFTKAFSTLPQSLEDIVTASVGSNADIMARIIAEEKKREEEERNRQNNNTVNQNDDGENNNNNDNNKDQLQQQQDTNNNNTDPSSPKKVKRNIASIGKQIIDMRRGLKTFGTKMGEGMDKFSSGVKGAFGNSNNANIAPEAVLLEGETLPGAGAGSDANNNESSSAPNKTATNASAATSNNTSVVATARKGSLLHTIIHRGFPLSFLKSQEELISGLRLGMATSGGGALNQNNNIVNNTISTTKLIEKLQEAFFSEFQQRSSEFLINDSKCRATVVDWANKRKNPYLAQTLVGRTVRLHSLLLTDACYTFDLLTLNAAASRAKNKGNSNSVPSSTQNLHRNSSFSKSGSKQDSSLTKDNSIVSEEGDVQNPNNGKMMQTTAAKTNSNMSATILEHGGVILGNVKSRLNHTIEKHVREAVAQVLFGVAAVFWEGTVIRWSHRYVQAEDPDHFVRVNNNNNNYNGNTEDNKNTKIINNDNGISAANLNRGLSSNNNDETMQEDNNNNRIHYDDEDEDPLALEILEGEKLDVNFAIEDGAYDELLQLCRDTVSQSIVDTL